MPAVATLDRDREMFDAWIAGQRQADIGARFGVSQQAVSDAVRRYRRLLPPLDRDAELDRSLALVDDLIAEWRPKAGQSLGAARLLDRLVNTRAKLAGLVESRVQVDGQVHVQHHAPVEPLDVVVERIRTRQGLPAPGQVQVQDIVEAELVEEVERHG
jgi:hypothetical protein